MHTTFDRGLALPFGVGFFIALAISIAILGVVEVAHAQFNFFNFGNDDAVTATTTSGTAATTTTGGVTTPGGTSGVTGGVVAPQTVTPGLPNTGFGDSSALMATVFSVFSLATLAAVAVITGRRFAR